MIGIYKITNLVSGKIYIGQSIQIEKRWEQHKKTIRFLEQDKWYNKIYLDMYFFGIENFSFEVVEECTIEELNEKEEYWIKYYNSQEDGYNVTSGGNCTGKLSSCDVKEIIDLLSDDKIMIDKIAEMYNVSDTTIRSINRGDEFYNSELEYPIRPYSKSIKMRLRDGNIIKNKNYKDGKCICPICGCEITNKANMCVKCYNMKSRKVKDRPSKEELLDLIKTKSFLEISRMYGVSDNAVRKWCKSYDLPYRRKDIKNII